MGGGGGRDVGARQASLFGDPPKYRVVVNDIEFFQRAATAQNGLPPQLANLLEKMSARVRRLSLLQLSPMSV